jgi:hypothetical protein
MPLVYSVRPFQAEDLTPQPAHFAPRRSSFHPIPFILRVIQQYAVQALWVWTLQHESACDFWQRKLWAHRETGNPFLVYPCGAQP